MHHAQALETLTGAYSAWVEAYGGISWQDFIGRLSKMKETGSSIREVIEPELKK